MTRPGLTQHIDRRCCREFEKCRARQLTKFQDLTEESSARRTTQRPNESAVDTSKWVVNPSARTLTTIETSLQGKGLNFAVIPDHIPATEIVASVEATLKRLDLETADLVRREVNTTLRRARPPRSNINREQRIALKALRQDRSIVILPADKGRASVILDTHTYRDKMGELISTGP